MWEIMDLFDVFYTYCIKFYKNIIKITFQLKCPSLHDFLAYSPYVVINHSNSIFFCICTSVGVGKCHTRILKSERDQRRYPLRGRRQDSS